MLIQHLQSPFKTWQCQPVAIGDLLHKLQWLRCRQWHFLAIWQVDSISKSHQIHTQNRSRPKTLHTTFRSNTFARAFSMKWWFFKNDWFIWDHIIKLHRSQRHFGMIPSLCTSFSYWCSWIMDVFLRNVCPLIFLVSKSSSSCNAHCHLPDFWIANHGHHTTSICCKVKFTKINLYNKVQIPPLHCLFGKESPGLRKSWGEVKCGVNLHYKKSDWCDLSGPFQKREIYIFVLCNLPGKEQLAPLWNKKIMSPTMLQSCYFLEQSSQMPFGTHLVSHGTYTAAAAPRASVMGSSCKSFYRGRKSLKWDAFPICKPLTKNQCKIYQQMATYSDRRRWLQNRWKQYSAGAPPPCPHRHGTQGNGKG